MSSTKREQIYITQQEIEKQNEILLQIKKEFSDKYVDINAKKPSYKLITYGCAMNERDSQTIDGMLTIAGFESCEQTAQADLILFNTCCVRDNAELKVFGNVGALKELKKENPSLIIGVCGCMMQQEEVAKHLYNTFKFVDMVFGTHSLHTLAQFLLKAINGKRVFDVLQTDGKIAENQPVLRKKPHTASINIMYGCDNFCTYCIVPFVRGRERSRNSNDILSEVERLANDGVLEITLLGQNVNSYNNDSQEQTTFAQLLEKISKIPQIKRIRFMTSHPKDISQELLFVISQNDKISNHIHLPVQAGSNDVLDRMKRRYTREHYMDIIDKARQTIPDVQITSDIIVGFPGETEKDFLQTLDLVESVKFDALFTYLYSPRKNTVAEKMPDQIDLEVKKQRLYVLNELQEKISQNKNKDLIGKTFEILVEGQNSKNKSYLGENSQEDKPTLIGRTLGARAINFFGEPSLLGKFVKVKITNVNKTSIFGELQ